MIVNNNFVLRKIYGKSILIPVRRNEAGIEPIFLNDTASLIWDYVSKELSRTEILENLREIYGINADSVENMAINSFIDQMINMKLIYENDC